VPPAVRPRFARREPRGRQRWFCLLLFWAGLGVSLWFWWHNTPSGSVDGPGAELTEAGRITGLVAGYALLVQVLLMSRLGVLERRIGANDLLQWHRDIGGLLGAMVVAHVGLIVAGYARQAGVGIGSETWTVLSTFEDMVSAAVATGILLGIALLSVRVVRASVPYEVWYRIHLTSYAVLLLSYGHQFATGRDLAMEGPGRLYWIGLYLAVIAALIWGRLLAPLVLNLRHRLRVADVVAEGPGMFSVYIGGRRLDELQARAGQFFRWRFLAAGCWSQAHPFSLSAAPNAEWLRLTIKAVGGHTNQLYQVPIGTRVVAIGPSGVFTADRRTRQRALLIAGGSGIAPIRALLEDLPAGTIVIYRAASDEEVIFADELDWLAEQREAEIYYVTGSRDEPRTRRAMSPRGMRAMVPDVVRRDVYLCGPEGLVNATVKTLRRLHVPRRQIHLDPFEF